jgi:hypothetical protein
MVEEGRISSGEPQMSHILRFHEKRGFGEKPKSL